MIIERIKEEPFITVGRVADRLGFPCFVVGGYVRDIFLNRPSKDIDIVTLGSGIELAEAVSRCPRRGARIRQRDARERVPHLRDSAGIAQGYGS